LRIHTHSPLPWDDQYTLFIGRAGFLPLARLVNMESLIMDSATLSSLVDQWRPETHSFHLPCGEATVTLQDVAMLLGLPIDGHPVWGPVDPAGWRDRVDELINIYPPDVRPNDKDKKPFDIHSAWLTANCHTCPGGSNDGVVQRYARSWL
jgi:hypothetical protein